MNFLFKKEKLKNININSLYTISDISNLLDIPFNNIDTIFKYNNVKIHSILGKRTRVYLGIDILNFIKNNYIYSIDFLNKNYIKIEEKNKKYSLYRENKTDNIVKIYNNGRIKT